MTDCLRVGPWRLLLSALTVAFGWRLLIPRRVSDVETAPAATPAAAMASAAPTASDERTRWMQRVLGQAPVAWLTVLAPVALWWVSLDAIDLEGIGRFGLSASLPAAWYAALAIGVAGAIRTVFAARFNGILVAAHVAVVILVVYATLPAVADMPQYAWTYKHIGVTNSIEQVGAVGPLVDIYHRWPAFFSLAAAFSRLSGLGDPLHYAAWAEPVFSLLGAVLVAAIAHTVSDDSRVAGIAALFFSLTAWVAQNYFAPQTLAFLIGLTLILVLLRHVPGRRPSPHWMTRLAGPDATRPASRWSGRTTLGVVFALNAVVVVTHQLSPYMILLSLATMAVLGVVRPRWLVLAVAVLPTAYLLLHLPYVQDNFGLFTSVNPSDNWRARVYDTTQPWLVAHAGGLVSACTWVLALLAVASLLWRRTGTGPLIVLALAVAPVFALLGGAYGGEASLRVHYFAAPWLAVLVAWGLVALPSSRWRTGATAVALAGVATLFLVAFFGRTALNVIPRDEVQASAYFYEHAEPNSLLVQVNPGFPMRVSARYTAMRAPDGGDTSPNLMARQNAELVRRASIPAVMATLRQLAGPNGSGRRYLVFSRSQARYADVNRILTFGQTRRLQSAVARSSQFRLWRQTANARIYQALAP